MSRKINIIGAGIAGLSAGCYLQMNGYETEIFELSGTAGGLCCAWDRKGYRIEGCIHWLVGSSPKDKFHDLWKELIDFSRIEFVDHDIYITVEDRAGNVLNVYTDVDKLENEMLAKAPQDCKLIKDFTGSIRKMLNVQLPVDKAPEIESPVERLKFIFKMIPYMGMIRKWMKVTAQDLADRCRNPLLKKTFELMFIPEMSAFFLVMTMVWMHKKAAGYPAGGSKKLIGMIEKRYKELDGKINYKSRVKKILTENGCAVGIELENGKIHKSDIVISAADGYSTIYDLLEGKFLDKTIEGYYKNFKTFPSYIQVSLGIKKKFDDLPATLSFPVEKPIVLDNITRHNYIGCRIFNFDRTLSPKGSTLITVTLPTYHYKYWVNLRDNEPKRYKQEKERIASEVIKALEKRLGKIKPSLEMTDISTPATVIRYTNNWKGSLEGWLLTPEVGLKRMRKTLPGLDNFYMIGQWVEPGGGIPTGLLSGRNVTQIICKKEKKPFKTSRD